MTIKNIIPWWAKLILKLLLARLPIKYSTWRKFSIFRHSPNNVNDSQTALKTFERYLSIGKKYMSFPKKYNCLEIGPGDSIITSLAAKKHGAENYWLIDAGKYSDNDLGHLINVSLDMGLDITNFDKITNVESLLKRYKINYKTDGLISFREVPKSSIDFAWSRVVLEHIHLDEFEQTLKELHRVLQPNAVSVHSVDFTDHLGNGLNNLRFSKNLWETNIFKNSGFYTNRIRPSQMINLLSKVGFETKIFNKVLHNNIPISRNKLSKDFKNISDEDLMITTMVLVVKAIKK